MKAGTPVMAGGGDQAAGAVGAGAVRPGVVSLTLGTSGVVFATTDAPLVEPEGRLHAFCHAVPGRWHFMGVTLSAAGSLQWYHDTLTPKESFAEIVAEAEQAPAGCEGLLFLPYLSGERTPYPDPHARGAFVGLTLRHRRAHMTRAVLEGVAFSMKDCFSLLQGAGLGAVSEVRIAGGGAKGALWRKIVASVLGVPMVTVNSTEGAAYGAALLGGVGAGAWPSGRGCLRRDDHDHRPRRAGRRVDEGLRRRSTRATASCTPLSNPRTTRSPADTAPLAAEQHGGRAGPPATAARGRPDQAGQALAFHQAEQLHPAGDRHTRAVGRDAERLGGEVGVEACELAPARRGVLAGDEGLREDARARRSRPGRRRRSPSRPASSARGPA